MDNLKSLLIFVLAIATLMLTQYSCGTTKNIRKGPLPARGQEEVYKALNQRNIDYNYFYGKANIDFESPDQSGSGSTQIRLVKDSVSWILIKKFSIEAARVLINKDSAFLLSRFEHTCSTGSIQEIKRTFGINLNYEDIENLLVGNILLPAQNQITSYIQDQENCVLKCSIDGFDVSYILDAYDLSLSKCTIKDRTRGELLLTLGSYRKVGKKMLPFNRRLTFSNSQLISGTVALDFTEIELNNPKAISFSIPNNYDIVPF